MVFETNIDLRETQPPYDTLQATAIQNDNRITTKKSNPNQVAIRVTVRHHIKPTWWIYSKTKEQEKPTRTRTRSTHTTHNPHPSTCEQIQPKSRDREVKDKTRQQLQTDNRKTIRDEDERQKSNQTDPFPSPKAMEPRNPQDSSSDELSLLPSALCCLSTKKQYPNQVFPNGSRVFFEHITRLILYPSCRS
jgi:hypothetical protein